MPQACGPPGGAALSSGLGACHLTEWPANSASPPAQAPGASCRSRLHLSGPCALTQSLTRGPRWRATSQSQGGPGAPGAALLRGPLTQLCPSSGLGPVTLGLGPFQLSSSLPGTEVSELHHADLQQTAAALWTLFCAQELPTQALETPTGITLRPAAPTAPVAPTATSKLVGTWGAEVTGLQPLLAKAGHVTKGPRDTNGNAACCRHPRHSPRHAVSGAGNDFLGDV